MRHFVKCLSLAIVLFSIRLYAYIPAEGNVTASYGPFLYRTNFSGSTQLPPSAVLGNFAFVVNGDLTDKGSLEIGLFHLNKIYYRNLNERYLAEKTELIHITMGYRRWLGEKYSAGLAFFAAYSIGDYETQHTESNVNLDIDTSARDTTEYGFDLSLQREFWNLGPESAVLDLRYAYSISNKENEKGDHYGLFIAFRRVIQEKNSRPSTSVIPADQLIDPRPEN